MKIKGYTRHLRGGKTVHVKGYSRKGRRSRRRK